MKVKVTKEELRRASAENSLYKKSIWDKEFPEFLELEAQPVEPTPTEEKCKSGLKSCPYDCCHSKAPKTPYKEQTDWIDRTNKALQNKGDKVLDELLAPKEKCLCKKGILRVTEPAIHTKTECKHVDLPEKINVTFPLNPLGETLLLEELMIKYNLLVDYLTHDKI